MKYMFYYLMIVNVVAWLVYGLDKQKAKRHVWRIPERVLIAFAAAGGSVGALAGMMMFRHKTKKPKFYIGVPVIMIAQVLILYYMIWVQ